MPPRSKDRRGVRGLEDRMDRMERIMEGLIQVVQITHNITANAPEPSVAHISGAEGVTQPAIEQEQLLGSPTFLNTLDMTTNESMRYREESKKRTGSDHSGSQSSKRHDSGTSSGNSSTPRKNTRDRGNCTTNNVPKCPTCLKKHRGTCRAGGRACYGCGLEGHQVKECPKRNRARETGTSTLASSQQSTVDWKAELPHVPRDPSQSPAP